MAHIGAGLLMFRNTDNGPEVLLVHPGGPYFVNKDDGVWSVPKGIAETGEEGDRLLETAKREFEEETGIKPEGPFAYIGIMKRRDGKTVDVWAFKGECDVSTIVSNTCTVEWPPRSGKRIEIPEVDRAAFFNLQEAREKLSAYQAPIINLFEKYIQSAKDSLQKTRSAGGIVLNAKGEILVVYEQGWYLPKGRVEQEETDLEAAKREIGEETGITQLTVSKDLGEYQRYRVLEDGSDDHSELKVIHMFLFSTDQGELAPRDSQIKEARWVSKLEIYDLLSNGKDREFVKGVLAKLD
ncbi:MAG: hydrolase [Parcubacteria group bacterium]|nr:hydrolase [Parcubacteria group bacterium]